MKQSDDGISHLITSYVNKKGPEFMKKLIKTDYLTELNCRIRFWELDSDIYNSLDKHVMNTQITDFLRTHYQTKVIEGRDLKTVGESKYISMVLDGIEYYDYSVLSPNNNLIPVLQNRGIKYISSSDNINKEYIPFNYGCIYEEDFNTIVNEHMDYLEVAQYTDGWGSCLPFVNVYALFQIRDIQENYIEIIHRSMYSRSNQREYLGNWYNLIGYIPLFLKQYQINIDWEKIYAIFNDFLDISLISR